MTELPLISLIVPFYNEGDSVETFARIIGPVIDSVPDTCWEIICINDGSHDDTLEHLLALAQSDKRYRVIDFSRNFGKEAALTAGLDDARGNATVIMDSDLQDPPELIGEMVERWRNGAEVVLARRIDRSADSHAKRVTASWFYKIYNFLAKDQIPENVGDFRLIDQSVVEALKRFPERQRFMKGLFSWVGFRTETVDYIRPRRLEGQTKLPPLALWNLALDGITSFSTLPLRAWSYLGACGAFLAFVYGVFILIRTLITGNDTPGYASLFCTVIFLGSVQILSIGVLGEYIGRIYMETKHRPVYITRRIYQRDGEKADDI